MRERLEESIEVIRALWTGENTSHHGRHYTVENARVYDVPMCSRPSVVAAGGRRSAELAARVGDGLWMSSIDAETIDAYRQAGGTGPIYGQVQVCWGPTKEEALRLAHEVWPNAGIQGQAMQELPSPAHFEQLAAMVKPGDMADRLPHGPDVGEMVEAIQAGVDAGLTHVHVHQIGPDQGPFLEFAARELLPRLRGEHPDFSTRRSVAR